MKNRFFQSVFVLFVLSIVLSGCTVNTYSNSNSGIGADALAGPLDDFCEQLQSQSLKDMCYSDSARNGRNPDFCNRVMDSAKKQECVADAS